MNEGWSGWPVVVLMPLAPPRSAYTNWAPGRQVVGLVAVPADTRIVPPFAEET